MSENSTVDDLDEHQLAAVEHGSGPLVIVAGAGTGKTQTLTARVARLLDAGVPPERILLLTFTRRAAAAMTSRAAALCGDPALGRRICGGTFHAVAYGLIAELAPCVGLADVSVLDASDVVDLLDLLREEHGLAGTSVRLPSTRALADVYSRAINTGRPTREVMAAEFPWCSDHAEAINGLLRDFVARKRQRGLLDFDDLLIYWRALLADAATGDRLRARWDWVLVDEYQDVNRIQVDIVRLLRPDGEGLTVVGDDAQAIYGFRGADAAHLLDLHTELPGSRLVRLDRNYRSTQEILDVANLVRPGELELTLVADREDRVGRPVLVACDSADAEARLVADAVLAAHRDGHSAARPGGADAGRQPQPSARDRAERAQDPVPQVRWDRVHEHRTRPRPARRAATRAQPGRRARLVSAADPTPGGRQGDRPGADDPADERSR